MIRYAYFILVLFLLAGCSSDSTEAPVALTVEEKATVESYATQLVNSFNGHDHALVRSSWSNDAFRKRVKDLNKTQRSVFAHIFEKEVKDAIKYTNLLLINNLNKQNGIASLTQSQHFNGFSEITIFMVFEDSYSFIKYRVELIEGKPFLCDLYDFKENTWYSESIKNAINLNSRYDAFSAERRNTNLALRSSDEALKRGDAYGALDFLYEIPQTHWVGNGLSLNRLGLAAELSDTIYAQVLETEFAYNQSLYLKYLYYLAFDDSTNLNQVYTDVKNLTGASDGLDSLIVRGSFWQ
ncbi:MAG: hypothetical protein HEP71_06505 [Roseivirga sp.]|nr:hypothetical protein [Roseivirga sp.]